MAAFAEGHTLDRMEKIMTGAFRFELTIRLPKYLSEGDYIEDFYLYHQMIECQMETPSCAELHSEGYYENFGRAVQVGSDGFCGLETIE